MCKILGNPENALRDKKNLRLCKFLVLGSIGDMITSHIREIAEKRGIQNAHQLAKRAEIPPNMAIRLWKDDFERVDKKTLNRLCRSLNSNPGQLLKYEADEE